MSVDSINSSINVAGSSDASASKTGMNKVKQDFESLQTALNAGNLEDAQKAFSDLQQDLGKVQGAGKTPDGGNSQDGTNSVQKDFQALQSALGAGDLEGAKKAFDALQSDIKTSRAHHGHHHHRATGSSTAPDSSTGGSNQSSTSTTGTQINVSV